MASSYTVKACAYHSLTQVSLLATLKKQNSVQNRHSLLAVPELQHNTILPVWAHQPIRAIQITPFTGCISAFCPSHFSSYGKRSFPHFESSTWNSLPTSVKLCKTLTSFKTNLKTYLFHKYLDWVVLQNEDGWGGVELWFCIVVELCVCVYVCV